MQRIILLSVLLLTLAACTPKTPAQVCDPAALYPQFVEWLDATSLAGVTPKVALADRVADMQRIKRDTANTKTHACMDNPRGNLVRSMEYTIRGYMDFMMDDTDGMNDNMKLAGIKMGEYTDEVNRIKLCAPDCE